MTSLLDPQTLKGIIIIVLIIWIFSGGAIRVLRKLVERLLRDF